MSTFRGVSPQKYTEHRRKQIPKLGGILAEYGYSLLLPNSKTKILGHSALYFLRLVRRFSRQSTGLIAQRKPAKRQQKNNNMYTPARWRDLRGSATGYIYIYIYIYPDGGPSSKLYIYIYIPVETRGTGKRGGG